MHQENHIEYRANEDQENSWHSTARPADDKLLDRFAIEDAVFSLHRPKTSDIYRKQSKESN